MHLRGDEFGSNQETVNFSHKERKSIFHNISKAIISYSYVSEWAMSCSYYFRSYASMLAERERQAQLKYFVIHPFSQCRFVWESFMIFVYVGAFFFIPFEACNVFFSQLNPKVFINYGFPLLLFHTVFIIDMVLNFFTGYIDHDEKTVILDKNSIANKYFKTYFFLDILATVPAVLNAIYLYILQQEHKALYNKIIIMNLLKIARIPTFFHYLTKMVNRYNWDGMAYRLSMMCLLSIFLFHWASCLYFIIPFTIKLKPITVFSGNTWIHSSKANLGKVSAGQFYLASLFNVVNLMLGCAASKRPQSWLELVTGVFYYILGGLYLSFLYIQILNIIRERMEPETNYDELITQVRDYMQHNQLPSDIQERTETFFQYRYQRIYYKENVIMHTLSERMRKEISDYGCRRMMTKINILNGLAQEVRDDLLPHFTMKMLLPKDVICKPKSVNRNLYFLSCGTLAVYTMSGIEVCHLHDGSYIGTGSLLMKGRKSIVYATALTISEVYQLDQDVFLRAVATNPEIFEEVMETAKCRLKEIRALEKIGRSDYDGASIHSEQILV